MTQKDLNDIWNNIINKKYGTEGCKPEKIYTDESGGLYVNSK